MSQGVMTKRPHRPFDSVEPSPRNLTLSHPYAPPLPTLKTRYHSRSTVKPSREPPQQVIHSRRVCPAFFFTAAVLPHIRIRRRPKSTATPARHIAKFPLHPAKRQEWIISARESWPFSGTPISPRSRSWATSSALVTAFERDTATPNISIHLEPPGIEVEI
jgi:hypothetical protein